MSGGTLLGILGLIVLAAGPAAGVQENPPVAVLTGLDGEPVEVLPLTFPKDAASLSIELCFKPRGAKALAGVKFALQWREARTLVNTAATLSLSSTGVDLLKTATTLSPGNPLPALLGIAGLTSYGSFSGAILAEVEGRWYTVCTLTSERHPAPILKVQGGGDPAGIKLSPSGADLKVSLTVASMNSAPVSDLSLSATSFTGPGADPIPARVTFNGKPVPDRGIAVGPLGTATFELEGTLPTLGIFSSELSLTYSGKRDLVPITVTRAKSAVPVEILGLETARGFKGFRSGDAEIELTLRELNGRPLTLDEPSLVSFKLKAASQALSRARYRSMEWSDGAGRVTWPLTLAAGKSRSLRLHIRGIQDPGEYTGSLRFGDLNTQHVDAAFGILIKERAQIACLFIALSVVGSLLLRVAMKVMRPRLIRIQTAVSLLRKLDALQTEIAASPPLSAAAVDVSEVLCKLRQQLVELHDQINMSVERNAEAQLQVVDQKLALIPPWVNAWRRLESLQSPEQAAPFRDKLTGAKQVLVNPAATAEDIAKSRTTVDPLADEIDKADREKLLEQLRSFRTVAEAQLAAALNPEVRKNLGEQVIVRLNTAETLLQSDKRPAAREAVEEAKTSYTLLLTDELKARMDKQLLPYGFAEADWNSLKQRVAGTLALTRQASASPTKAIEYYNTAFGDYLRAISGALSEELRLRADNLKKRPSPPSNKDTLLEILGTVRTALEKIPDKVRSGDLRTADETYSDALRKCEEIFKGLKTAGLMAATDPMMPAATGSLFALLPRSETMATGSIAPREPGTRRGLRDLALRLAGLDAILMLFLLVVAVLSGLKILWCDDPVWGGWNAYLVAILWGLGLHQAGGALFDVSGLAGKLAVPLPGETPVAK